MLPNFSKLVSLNWALFIVNLGADITLGAAIALETKMSLEAGIIATGLIALKGAHSFLLDAQKILTSDDKGKV